MHKYPDFLVCIQRCALHGVDPCEVCILPVVLAIFEKARGGVPLGLRCLLFFGGAKKPCSSSKKLVLAKENPCASKVHCVRGFRGNESKQQKEIVSCIKKHMKRCNDDTCHYYIISRNFYCINEKIQPKQAALTDPAISLPHGRGF